MFKLRLLIICLLGTTALAQTPEASEEEVKVRAPAESAERPTEPAADEIFVPAEDIQDDLPVSYPIDI